VRGGTVRRADQHGETDGVDETDLVEVDHHRVAAGCYFEEALAQPGHCVDIDLPGGGHDRIVVSLPDLNGECLTHG
jgi:hypothetical protein